MTLLKAPTSLFSYLSSRALLLPKCTVLVVGASGVATITREVSTSLVFMEEEGPETLLKNHVQITLIEKKTLQKGNKKKKEET